MKVRVTSMLDLPDGADLGLVRLRFLECLDQEFAFENVTTAVLPAGQVILHSTVHIALGADSGLSAHQVGHQAEAIRSQFMAAVEAVKDTIPAEYRLEVLE